MDGGLNAFNMAIQAFVAAHPFRVPSPRAVGAFGAVPNTSRAGAQQRRTGAIWDDVQFYRGRGVAAIAGNLALS